VEGAVKNSLAEYLRFLDIAYNSLLLPTGSRLWLSVCWSLISY